MTIQQDIDNRVGEIWLTSDTHFGHKNIVKGCSDWPDTSRCREFNTLHRHNAILVNSINAYVKPDDILIHLGDWSFGGINNIEKFRSQIICQNIHLILGNHDHHIECNRNNVQELFNSVQHYAEIVVDKQLIILSHYSHRIWKDLHKSSWMCYGHSHGTLLNYGKSMDVGIDTHPEFRPYHVSEIKTILNKQPIKFVDHHNTETT